MAISGGVAPHNGWIEINGQRFQVISGTVEYNTLSNGNTLSATVPLNAPGYLEAIAPLTGRMSEKVKAIVLSQNNEAELMTAYIKCITFNLVATVILVQGEQGFSELNDHQTTDTFVNKRGDECVGELCKRIGLPFSGVPSKILHGKKIGQDYVRLTDNIPYLTAMYKHAELDGVRLYMDENGTVQYRPPGTGGAYSVYWKRPTPQTYMISDCIELRVVHNLDASAPHEQTNAGYKPAEKKTNTATATSPGVGKPTQGYQDSPNLESEQLMQQAKATADSRADHEWEIQAVVVGDPSIKTDMNVALSGSGLLDQTCPIDTIIHKFGYEGYTTTINAKGKGNRAGAS